MKKSILPFLFVSFLMFITKASAQPDVPMADGLRAEGKIYVVVAILLVIFLGLFTYLFMMDKRISKIEKKRTEKK